MKRNIVLFLCLAILLPCCLSFSSCRVEGKSAYELAAEAGFTGSLDEWLESLKGSDGKDGKDGRDGENGGDGKDGEDGQNGKDGENGQNGKDGENGKDGKNGEDGKNLTYIIDGAEISLSIQDVYGSAVKAGYKGALLDFISDYLSGYTGDPSGAAIAYALLSSVSIYSEFEMGELAYYERYGSYPSEDEHVIYYSSGSGVIYSMDKERGDAYIITNYHVVYDKECDTDSKISDKINIYLYGSEYQGSEIPAVYVGGSLEYDIAVLKVEGNEQLRESAARAASFADSNQLSAGQRATAIGNPNFSGISVSSGIVSVDSEYIALTAADDMTLVSQRVMRIDTPVNSGNSGGGLFDGDGRLIGIVNAKLQSFEIENIGYALPSNVVRFVAQNIIDNFGSSGSEDVYKCMLGVTISAQDSRAVYDPETGLTSIVETVAVISTTEGGLAAGKLLPDDIIVSVYMGDELHRITRTFMLVDLMLTGRVGDTVFLRIIRNGEETDIAFNLTKECITAVK